MKTAMKALLLAAAIGAASQGLLARQQPTATLQALDDQLPGDLINDPSNMAWNITGKNMTMKTLRDASIPGGGAGVSIKVGAQGTDPWEVQAQAPLIGPIESGQIVTVGFYARTISAATSDKRGEITVRVQQAVSPYSGFIDKILPIGPDWAFYEASAKATRKLGSGEAVVALQLAGAKQELELGQMIVVTNAASIVASPPPAGTKSQPAPPPISGPPTLPDSLKGKGTLLVDPRKRDNWDFYGPGVTHAAGTSSVVGVMSIKTAVAGATPHPYDAAITIPLDEAIKKGDTIIIAVAARTNASEGLEGEGKLSLRVIQNVSPWPGFGDTDLSFSPGKWQIQTVHVDATQDIPARQAAVQVQLGKAKQDLDIGPIFVLRQIPAK